MKSSSADTISRRRWFVSLLLTPAIGWFGGCQDGPMYALKHVNPYFTMREWRADNELGITDHQRREELLALSKNIDSLTPERQRYWAGELGKIMQHDQSAEMRRLAVNAAGRIDDPAAMAIIDQGLDDDIAKVRMEACRALGRRGDEDATRMLAATLGTETEDDVRNAAIAALANHQNKIAVDALRNVLTHRDPAVRSLVMQSLRTSTGKDYGDDTQVWIAALDGKDVPAKKPGIFRGLF